jgi:hypothetical protein
MSHMNAASPRQSLVKGERLTRYELAAVMPWQRWTAARWLRRQLVEAGAVRGRESARTASSQQPAARFARAVGRGLSWPPRVRRRPLSEIALWITGSPASWRVSQTPECNGLLTATRGVYMIAPQRQPGKFDHQGALRGPGPGPRRVGKRARDARLRHCRLATALLGRPAARAEAGR